MTISEGVKETKRIYGEHFKLIFYYGKMHFFSFLVINSCVFGPWLTSGVFVVSVISVIHPVFVL